MNAEEFDDMWQQTALPLGSTLAEVDVLQKLYLAMARYLMKRGADFSSIQLYLDGKFQPITTEDKHP